jgi:SAM-dependent methyltransferase
MGDWFESWFDSEYYHILYKDRDEKEAQNFLRNLSAFLKMDKNARVLDLACGKGRHAIYLNSLGLDVTGADLSANSISFAGKFANERLRFVVQDMREPLEGQKFDFVLNLFTSFGYFHNIRENLEVLRAAHAMLHEKGILVIDFMNAVKVQQNLVDSEEKTCGGVTFRITRKVENQCVVKTIRFEESEREHVFTERVQLLTLADFEEMFQKTGFKLQTVFGDYNLGTFAPANSERLILVAAKN